MSVRGGRGEAGSVLTSRVEVRTASCHRQKEMKKTTGATIPAIDGCNDDPPLRMLRSPQQQLHHELSGIVPFCYMVTTWQVQTCGVGDVICLIFLCICMCACVCVCVCVCVCMCVEDVSANRNEHSSVLFCSVQFSSVAVQFWFGFSSYPFHTAAHGVEANKWAVGNPIPHA